MTTRFYTFNTNSTSISYSWPKGLTGLERIALSSQGDLQRVLSAFFSRPIQIVPLTTHTRITVSSDLPDIPLNLPNDDALSGVSPTTPITQTRQVLLQCAGRTVCTATSTVRITSPHAAKLFLVDKYPIGQMFRKLEKLPDFELLAVDFGLPDLDKESKNTSGEQLWRKYRLFVDGYEAEILEVFPSRRMFEEGEAWLVSPTQSQVVASSRGEHALAHHRRLALFAVLVLIILILYSESGESGRFPEALPYLGWN